MVKLENGSWQVKSLILITLVLLMLALLTGCKKMESSEQDTSEMIVPGTDLFVSEDNTVHSDNSNQDRYERLPTGTVIADHFDDFKQNDYGDCATYTSVPVTGQNFTEALQIEVQKKPSSDYRINITTKSKAKLHQDDIILVSFYARTIVPSSSGSGQLRFLLEHSNKPYTKYVSWPIDIGIEWMRYYIPFTVQVWRGMGSSLYVSPPSDGDNITFGAKEVRFRFSLGYHPQQLQLADMRVVNFGTSVTGDQLPCTQLPPGTDNHILPAISLQDVGTADWTPNLLADADGEARYLPDFSYAGYRNSEKAMPDGNGWTVVNVIDHGATPNDDTDDTAAIQNAIKAADDVPGPVILSFPSGLFIISDVLIINRDNFLLQGAGSQTGGTVILPSKAMKDMTKPPLIQSIEQDIILSKRRTEYGDLYSAFSWSGGVIWIGSTEYTGPADTVTKTTGTARRGDHKISTVDASNLAPGQVVLLRYNDNSFANPFYDHIFDCTAADLPDGFGPELSKKPEVEQCITVVSVSGNDVTFKEPLNHDIQKSWHCDLKTMDWFTEIGVEGITIEFQKTNYSGHHIEDGYNGIYIKNALNCWVRDVKINNSDSGIMIESSKNITVQDVIIDGRDGHYTLMACDSDQILFRDFKTNARTCHGPSFNTNCRTTVFTHGQIHFVSFDQHNGMNHQNLLDDLDLTGEIRHLWKHGGNHSRRPTHGAFNTSWNLRFSPAGKVPVLGTAILDGPSAYLIGLSSDAMLMFTYGPNAYTEGLGRRDIAISSLYEYQLKRRTVHTRMNNASKE